MADLFLYGTLRHPALLELVSGQALDRLAPEPAWLDGFRTVWAAGEDFPLIEEAPGEAAEGLLLRGIEADTLARLDHYELGFGYRLRDVTVRSAAGDVAARVYVPEAGLWQAGEPFSLDHWVRAHWPLTRHAAAELMGYFGRFSGAELAWRWRMVRSRAAATALAEAEEVPSAVRGAQGRDAVDLVGERLDHAGFFVLKTLNLRHLRFDGSMSALLEREVVLAGDAAIVLPYDPLRDRVLLVEQFRTGPYMRGERNPWLLEPVAGRIDAGEAPETCARREAGEETGLVLRRVEHIARCYSSPGYSTEVYHCFLGLAELPDDAAGLGGVADEHEDIRSHVLDFDAALRLIKTGEAKNAPLILSLLWLARERDRLRASRFETA